jgi:hypothetical protein
LFENGMLRRITDSALDFSGGDSWFRAGCQRFDVSAQTLESAAGRGVRCSCGNMKLTIAPCRDGGL